MSDSVEYGRLRLLEKSRLAYQQEEDAKAIRILKRIAAMTAPNAPSLPVVTSLRPSNSSVSPLPLLSETITSASQKLPLPTHDQPPMFLLQYNIGITHLKAGRLALARIYLTRAVEESQTVSTIIAPYTVLTPAPTPTTNSVRGTLAPTATTSVNSSPAVSNRTIATTNINHNLTSSSAVSCSQSAYHFLRCEQRRIYQAIGTALLLMHSLTASSCEPEDAIEGLKLAYRSFRLCIDSASEWTHNAPSGAVDSSTPPSTMTEGFALLHARAAESLIELHRVESTISDIHPILQHTKSNTSAMLNAEPVLNDSNSCVGTQDEFVLDHAVMHLERAIIVLRELPSSNPPSERITSLLAQLNLQLAHVLLSLSRPREALELLAPYVPGVNPSSSSSVSVLPLTPDQRVRAEQYVLESLLALGELDRADSLATVLSSSPSPTEISSEIEFDRARHLLTSRIFIAVHRKRDQHARQLLDKALRSGQG